MRLLKLKKTKKFSDFSKFLGIESEPIEMLSEQEMIEQGMIEPITDDWSRRGELNNNYKDGSWINGMPEGYTQDWWEKAKQDPEYMKARRLRQTQERLAIKDTPEYKERKRKSSKKYYDAKKEMISARRKQKREKVNESNIR